MQPVGLGSEVTEWHESSKAGCLEATGWGPLHQAPLCTWWGWFLLRNWCAFATCHTLLCTPAFVIKSNPMKPQCIIFLFKGKWKLEDRMTFLGL